MRLLLVNGNRSDLAVPLSDSVRRVKGRLLAEWPKEWSLEERPGSVEHLRLLYHGRFLEDRLILEGRLISLIIIYLFLGIPKVWQSSIYQKNNMSQCICY